MRRGFTLVSIVVHAIVITVVFIAQVFAVGPLPIPRVPLNFIGAVPITIVEPPAPPPAQRANTKQQADDVSQIAPIEPPSVIGPEAPRDPSPPRPGLGFVDGVPDSIGLGLVAPPPPPPAPPPPPPPQGPLRIGGGVQPPRKLVHVDPVYPQNAQTARVEGVVILEATIDTRGRVVDLSVLRAHPLLEHAAVGAVRQWVYSPTLLNGVPVPIVMTVTVRFTLQDR
jgi:periplasmic protein TonB